MTAPRFDMYTLVHKGQRKKLFELSVAAGQLAPGDTAARESLIADLDATLASLVDHAEAEETYFGPLYLEAAPATGTALATEHGALEDAIADVRSAAQTAATERSSGTDLALYRAIALFTSKYLAHIAVEEGSMPELWARFDDGALARTQGALVASHPAASVQFNLRNMLPAASPAERIGFLTNLRRNMPPPAFAGVRALVGSLVPASEWSSIDAA